MNDRQPMGKVEARAVRVTVEVTTNLPQETTWNPLKEDFEYSGKCFCNISGVIDDCEVELDFMMKGDFGGAQSYVIPAKHYFHGGGNQNIPIKIRADFAEGRYPDNGTVFEWILRGSYFLRTSQGGDIESHKGNVTIIGPKRDDFPLDDGGNRSEANEDEYHFIYYITGIVFVLPFALLPVFVHLRKRRK